MAKLNTTKKKLTPNEALDLIAELSALLQPFIRASSNTNVSKRLGMSRQSYEYHVKKAREKKK